MEGDRNTLKLIEEAKKHQDFRLEKMLLVLTGEICAQMEKLGINRAELASRLNTSRAFVTKILKCNHNVTLKTIESIAHALEMEVDVHLKEAKDKEIAYDRTLTFYNTYLNNLMHINHVQYVEKTSHADKMPQWSYDLLANLRTDKKTVCHSGTKVSNKCQNTFERGDYDLAS